MAGAEEAAAAGPSRTASAPRKKRLDPRVQALINNNVFTSHRSFFVLVGDKGRNQVVNLHYLLSQARHSARPSVLWCYKKELGFTSNRKKREARVKRDVKRGLREVGEMDPFELFVSVTDIRYTYYKDTHKILGQTFGMVVLQDFEALTPNLLARTIETVEGGGLVILLLSTMRSLRQLYTLSMDAHSRFRTEATANADLTARFNERFILSLGGCADCLVLDDELNVLPLSAGKDVEVLDKEAAKTPEALARQQELDGLKDDLKDTKPIGDVIRHARTLDQAKALLTFTEAITEKALSSTVTLTAARGRGKSAALGLAIALAVASSYSNIFVTSPSPENLKTLFDFLLKGFDALGYEEHLDYDVHQSTNSAWNNAVVRVNIFRQHRQTVQYIQPQDAHVLGQAELVVIDEAAAIPLPLVKNLLGPYLVFMASTVNGYEGTGRSLSLKLIQQLRELSRPSAPAATSQGDSVGGTVGGSSINGTVAKGKTKASLTRALREIRLDEPIRYAAGDQIERWLHQLLCLDATLAPAKKSHATAGGCPHPNNCDLYYVNRDALFSFHPTSELFLQRMMALYVASHYKNTPNDLQLMADAPGHHLFILLPPIRDDDVTLPEPLVVLQVALEGQISKASVMASLHRGIRAAGDLIPWTVSQQFQDDGFAGLSGARIVRIATHPDYAKMGYGSRAMSLLERFYGGELFDADEAAKARISTDAGEGLRAVSRVDEKATLATDKPKVRDASRMPPLLQRLSERSPERLDWLGVSYGLTAPLLRFWKRAGYVPMYLRQTPNDLTGEYTCLMLRGLESRKAETEGWLSEFAQDFRKRFLSLLSFKFREFASVMSLSVLEAATAGEIVEQKKPALTPAEISSNFSPFDQKRLDSYSNNMLDYHVILDLLPTLSTLYFSGRFPQDCRLSAVQSSILLSLGLQRKSVEDIEGEIGLPVSQILALFVKVVRKLSKAMLDIRKHAISETLPDQAAVPKPSLSLGEASASAYKAPQQVLQDELLEEGDEVARAMREQQRDLINTLDLHRYTVGGNEADWKAAEEQIVEGKAPTVSVKNPLSTKGKRKADDGKADGKGSKENKKKKHRPS